MNGYVYVGADPATHIDPNGQSIFGDVVEGVSSFFHGKDIGTLAGDLFSNKAEELYKASLGVLAGAATEFACNVAIGAAAIPTGGASIAVGEGACTAGAIGVGTVVEKKV